MKKSTLYFALSALTLALMGAGYIWMQDAGSINGQTKADKSVAQKESNASILYEVPKSDLKSKKFVKDAMPTAKGDYTVTPQGVRMQLIEDKKLNGKVTSGSVSYQVNRVQLLKNSIRTEAGIAAVRKAMNVPNLPKHFVTAEIHYKITNHSDRVLMTDGVATVSYGYKNVMTSLGGMVNGSELSHDGVAPGMTKEGYAIVWVPKKSAEKFNKFNIEFASTYDQNGHQISEKTRKLKVNV